MKRKTVRKRYKDPVGPEKSNQENGFNDNTYFDIFDDVPLPPGADGAGNNSDCPVPDSGDDRIEFIPPPEKDKRHTPSRRKRKYIKISKRDVVFKHDDDKNNEPPGYKTVSWIFAGLIILLLIFFLGMRYIERDIKAQPEMLTTVFLQTDTAEEASAEISLTVNINTANKYELMKLPGIGEAKAEAIIAYRNEYGRFTDTAQIKNISGIGDKLYEKIKDMITADNP